MVMLSGRLALATFRSVTDDASRTKADFRAVSEEDSLAYVPFCREMLDGRDIYPDFCKDTETGRYMLEAFSSVNELATASSPLFLTVIDANSSRYSSPLIVKLDVNALVDLARTVKLLGSAWLDAFRIVKDELPAREEGFRRVSEETRLFEPGPLIVIELGRSPNWTPRMATLQDRLRKETFRMAMLAGSHA